MSWHTGFEAYQFFMQGRRLPIKIIGPQIRGDFIAFYIEVDNSWLPRPNATRGWELHVSLGFLSEYRTRGVTDDTVMELITTLNGRWSGKHHMLTVEWVGNGAALMIHRDDALALDPIVDYLSAHGGYDRQLHISA